MLQNWPLAYLHVCYSLHRLSPLRDHSLAVFHGWCDPIHPSKDPQPDSQYYQPLVMAQMPHEQLHAFLVLYPLYRDCVSVVCDLQVLTLQQGLGINFAADSVTFENWDFRLWLENWMLCLCLMTKSSLLMLHLLSQANFSKRYEKLGLRTRVRNFKLTTW